MVIFYDFVVLRFCGGIFVVFYFSVFVLIDVISGYFFDVSFRLCVLVYYNDVIWWCKIWFVVIDVFDVERNCGSILNINFVFYVYKNDLICNDVIIKIIKMYLK